MRNILLTIILTSAIGFSSFSQEEKEEKNTDSPVHAIGTHLGSTTGIGLSYRFFPKKLGVQATFLPVFRGDGGLFLSSGLSLMYKFKSSRRVDLFGYLGNHFTYNEDPVVDFYQEDHIRRRYHLGLGGGINLHVWIDVLDISFQLGYGLYNVTNNPTTLPAGEMGIYYRF